MFEKKDKNYLLTIMLVIISFTCMLTGVALAFKPSLFMPILVAIKFKSLHEWTGYLLIILISVHLLLHAEWIQMVTKTIVKNKKKFTAALVVALLSVGLCITISMVSTDKKAPNGKNGNPYAYSSVSYEE